MMEMLPACSLPLKVTESLVIWSLAGLKKQLRGSPTASGTGMVFHKAAHLAEKKTEPRPTDVKFAAKPVAPRGSGWPGHRARRQGGPRAGQ